MPSDAWERAIDELRTLIGDVSLNLAAIEEGLDWLLAVLIAQPPVQPFFREHILGRMMVGQKVELLRRFVKLQGDLLADAPSALDWLGRIEEASRLRNRLVHDLHEVSFVDGSIVRRRIWQREGGESVNLDDYRELAGITSLLTGPAFDAFVDSIFHVGDDEEIDEPAEDD